jgi:hypothetical protein
MTDQSVEKDFLLRVTPVQLLDGKLLTNPISSLGLVFDQLRNKVLLANGWWACKAYSTFERD